MNYLRLFFSLSLSLCLSGCGTSSPALTADAPDLVIYTYQEEAIYEPIVKEYQERTGLSVQVLSGTYQNLLEHIAAGTLADDFDLVLGIDSTTLMQNSTSWMPYSSPLTAAIYPEFQSNGETWTAFSALPLVIMYNTRVVTYRELPEGWNSLLEPRWKGRIAFMDPTLSDIYSKALATAMYTAADPPEYALALVENLENRTYESLSAVNHAIAEGRCFLGVTLEEKAESLRREGADIDYIYPEEGTCVLVDGSAVIAGCERPEQAKAFIDFTLSVDVQHFLTSTVNRRSVRTDAPPPNGLSQLTQLPVTHMDARESIGQYQTALEIWQKLQQNHMEERR